MKGRLGDISFQFSLQVFAGYVWLYMDVVMRLLANKEYSLYNGSKRTKRECSQSYPSSSKKNNGGFR